MSDEETSDTPTPEMASGLDWAGAIKADMKRKVQAGLCGKRQIDYATHVGISIGKLQGAIAGRRMKQDTIDILMPHVGDLLADNVPRRATVATAAGDVYVGSGGQYVAQDGTLTGSVAAGRERWIAQGGTLTYDQAKQQLLDRYAALKERLGGRPAPPFGLPSAYRVDACPPEDWDGWHAWMDRVEAHLDRVDGSDPGTIDTRETEEPAGDVVATWAYIRHLNEEPERTSDPQELVEQLRSRGIDAELHTPDPSWDQPVEQPESDLERQLRLSIEQAQQQHADAAQVGYDDDGQQLLADDRAEQLRDAPTAQILEFPGSTVAPARVERTTDVLVLDPSLRYITNGEVNTALRCRRKWWLEYYRRVGWPTEKRTGAAPTGIRVHKALAVLYVPEGESPGDPLAELEWTIADDREYILKNAASQEAADGQLRDLEKEAELCRAMVEGYVDWLAETGVDARLRTLTVEQPLVADPGFPDFPHARLLTKTDVKVQDERDSSISFMDHKVVQNFPDMISWAHMNPQMRHYMLAEFLDLMASHMVEEIQAKGLRVDAAMLNMVRKVKRTARANPPFFQRHTVRHNIETLRSHWEKVHGVLLMMETMRQQLDAGWDHKVVAPPTPSRDCSWECPFFAICPSFDDGTHVEAFITENLATVDPLQRYEPELRPFLPGDAR